MLAANSCSLGAWFLFIFYSVQFNTSVEPTMVEDWAEFSFGSRRKTQPQPSVGLQAGDTVQISFK